MHRIVGFGLLLLVMAVSPALADYIDGPYTTTAPIPVTLTDWNRLLPFPQFNSLGGTRTLTGVQLDLSASLDTIITIQNLATDGSSGTVRTECQFTVQDVGGNLIAPEIDLMAPVPPYVYNLFAGQTISSPLFTKSGTSSNLYTAAAVLSEFTGPGSISLNASTFTTTLLSNTGGNTAADQVTHGQLTGTVTYLFTPEPASLLLLAVSGLLLRRR